MSRRFTSYLLRLWERDDGDRRIEIEQIQEGARTVVTSTAAALDWIDAHTNHPTTRDPTTSEKPTGAVKPDEPP